MYDDRLGILGTTVMVRTDTQDHTIKERVGELWGVSQCQMEPSFYYETTRQVQETSLQDKKTVARLQTVTDRHDVAIEGSNIKVDLKLAHRKKGLLWYSTYKVRFSGTYKISNRTDAGRLIMCSLQLPASQALYDNFKFVLGGHTLDTIHPNADQITDRIQLDPKQTADLVVSYDSQGLDQWRYSFATGVSQVRNFAMRMTTDFKDIDFPAACISPTEEKKTDNGWLLTWQYGNLLTGYSLGVEMPKLLNPGPWVSKVTFFAPVSLFLFYFLLFMIATVKGIKIHPMNYFFISAGFFSFHLLLAYLVDHISVEIAFVITSFVSIFLVISYMRLVVPGRFAYIEVGIAQLVYLVLFSYTFFFEQYTGLIVTILCILTLFVMMQYTGRVDWDEVFEKKSLAGKATDEPKA